MARPKQRQHTGKGAKRHGDKRGHFAQPLQATKLWDALQGKVCVSDTIDARKRQLTSNHALLKLGTARSRTWRDDKAMPAQAQLGMDLVKARKPRHRWATS